MAFSTPKRRVVVTGMGALTPLGLTIDEYWNNLLNGKSGVGPITYFDAANFETKFAAQLKGFDVMKFLDRKTIQRTDPFTHYALVAASLAIQD